MTQDLNVKRWWVQSPDGPRALTVRELMVEVLAGHVTPKHLVAREDGVWGPMSEVPELMALFSSQQAGGVESERTVLEPDPVFVEQVMRLPAGRSGPVPPPAPTQGGPGMGQRPAPRGAPSPQALPFTARVRGFVEARPATFGALAGVAFLMLLGLGVRGCGASPEELAAEVADPCATMASPPPVDQLAGDERTAFLTVAARRCYALRCPAFGAAMQAGDTATLTATAREIMSVAPYAASPDPSCASAGAVITVTHQWAEIEEAAGARSWRDLLRLVPELSPAPTEVRELFAPTAALERFLLSCVHASQADAGRAEDANQWGRAKQFAEQAVACAGFVAVERRPELSEEQERIARADEALALEARRREVCGYLSSARSTTNPHRVISSLETLLRMVADTDEITSRERSRLQSALRTAQREAARCQRRERLADRCAQRCAIQGERRNASWQWFDRCAQYCSERAPTCLDEDERRTRRGQPASGVTVPSVAYCEASGDVGAK